jgi:hypothetical protein
MNTDLAIRRRLTRHLFGAALGVTVVTTGFMASPASAQRPPPARAGEPSVYSHCRVAYDGWHVLDKMGGIGDLPKNLQDLKRDYKEFWDKFCYELFGSIVVRVENRPKIVPSGPPLTETNPPRLP